MTFLLPHGQKASSFFLIYFFFIFSAFFIVKKKNNILNLFYRVLVSGSTVAGEKNEALK